MAGRGVEPKESRRKRRTGSTALEGMADSEMEIVSILAFQLKYQSTEIRATRNLVLERDDVVTNRIPTEMAISEEALYYKKKVKRMRNLITYKLKTT